MCSSSCHTSHRVLVALHNTLWKQGENATDAKSRVTNTDLSICLALKTDMSRGAAELGTIGFILSNHCQGLLQVNAT